MSAKVTRTNAGYRSVCENCGVECDEVQVYLLAGHPTWEFLCGRCWVKLGISGS